MEGLKREYLLVDTILKGVYGEYSQRLIESALCKSKSSPASKGKT